MVLAMKRTINLKIYEKYDDIRFLNSSIKILDKISTHIPKYTLIKKKGGLPGSYPFWGRYMILRQPNWATKFLVDAIMLEKQMLNKFKGRF